MNRVLCLLALLGVAHAQTVTSTALNPTWTLMGNASDATITYTVQPGQTVRYGTTSACAWLASTASKGFSGFSGQSLAYLYYTNKGTTAVTFGKGSAALDTFFGQNPAVWCDKSVWRQDVPAFPTNVQQFVCPSTCVTLLQNTDPKVSIRLTGGGAYVEVMTSNEVAAWFAVVQAYRAAWVQGLTGPKLDAVTLAMNQAGIKIAKAHGCLDSQSFQIVDPGFVVVLNGTPVFVGTNPPLAPIPAGGAQLSTTGPVSVGMFAR